VKDNPAFERQGSRATLQPRGAGFADQAAVKDQKKLQDRKPVQKRTGGFNGDERFFISTWGHTLTWGEIRKGFAELKKFLMDPDGGKLRDAANLIENPRRAGSLARLLDDRTARREYNLLWRFAWQKLCCGFWGTGAAVRLVRALLRDLQKRFAKDPIQDD